MTRADLNHCISLNLTRCYTPQRLETIGPTDFTFIDQRTGENVKTHSEFDAANPAHLINALRRGLDLRGGLSWT